MEESFITLGRTCVKRSDGIYVTSGRRVVRLSEEEGIVYKALRYGEPIGLSLERISAQSLHMEKEDLRQVITSLMKRHAASRWDEDSFSFLYPVNHAHEPMEVLIDFLHSTGHESVDAQTIAINMMIWEMADGSNSVLRIRNQLQESIDHPDYTPTEMVLMFLPPLICADVLSLIESHTELAPTPSE